ncbi:MAG: helix-turn-helix transcriptional regulator [Oscillospiraceae bacterium]|nr:helix-turn-helix transcriptional regulator [Oscillospiraceae bacterium]
MNNIKAIREAKGITQKGLAKAANISAPFLYDLEQNRRGAKPETWARIADALGVEVNDLIDREQSA